MFDQKYFWIKHFFSDPKFFFGSKGFFGPDISFEAQNLFGLKKKCGAKFFQTKTFSLIQIRNWSLTLKVKSCYVFSVLPHLILGLC